MLEKFTKLIDICKNGIPLTTNNIGEGMTLVDRGTFQLVIPSDNTDEYGEFFIHSIKGHDCYSYNSESEDIYNIIDGEGKFIIEDQVLKVHPGDTIKIEPNQVFTYIGNMIMILEMIPNFKEENDHFVSKVKFDEEG